MKNKYTKHRIIGALLVCVAIVFFVLCGVILNNGASTSDVLPMIFLGIAVVTLIVGLIWYAAATAQSRKFCSKCGLSMRGCEYEYQEVKREPATDNSYKVVVDIRAICPHCQSVKQFQKSFTVRYNENPQYHVDRFCRDKFGH